MPKPIDPELAAYLDSFPAATRKALDKIRATVRKAVPDAEERRSYGVGAFRRGGTYVLYYAGYPKHVSIYPVYPEDTALGAALKPYLSGKATAKFPLDKPVPQDLIAQIVKAKVAEHQGRLEQRAAKEKGTKGVPAKRAKKAAPKKSAVKKPAKKAAKQSTKAKRPAKLTEVPNLSWALLDESVAAQGVGRKRAQGAKSWAAKRT